MRKLSGVLISYNEEEKIESALSSMRGICDEIVVVDSHSTDTTTEICRSFTDRVHERPWHGYRDQKQYATDLASQDWVLSLDADEELSPELQEELLKWKGESGSNYDGYMISRVAYFMGRWIEHTSWSPDWQLRLFKRSSGRWKGGRVHEGFKLRGPVGKFAGQINHYTYASISEYLEQLENFSSLAARDYHERGKKAKPRHLILDPPSVFFKSYFLRRGFLDGVPGLVVSVLAATSAFFKYLKLWEIQRCSSQLVHK